MVSWTKGFGCTGVIGNDVVLMLQQAINRRKVKLTNMKGAPMTIMVGLAQLLGPENRSGRLSQRHCRYFDGMQFDLPRL